MTPYPQQPISPKCKERDNFSLTFKSTYLDLIIWILVRPVPDDVPLKCLRAASVTPDVLNSFVVNIQVTFRYRFHIFSGNSQSQPNDLSPGQLTFVLVGRHFWILTNTLLNIPPIFCDTDSVCSVYSLNSRYFS